MTDAPYAFDPATYQAVVAEIPEYERLQAEVAAATVGLRVGRFLDLGAGTGATTLSVLAQHPEATAVILDESEAMLAAARSALGEAVTVVVAGLADPLPDGPFDLVVSALAVHHLDGPGKADLFRRVARLLTRGGRFVLGDLVVPEDPTAVVTEIDGVVDLPSSAADQLAWLGEAGLTASTTWSSRDVAVLVGTKPKSPPRS
jgi:tRNA (cmo5U34)-methyltransferase